MTSFCPDVNVWLALAYDGHQHHQTASNWFAELDDDRVYFCRLTQLGLLRLVTQSSVMRDDVQTQAEAWQTYDAFYRDERVLFQFESDPQQVSALFRKLTWSPRSASKQWADAYLAAFAQSSGLTLVTFDRALYQIAGNIGHLLN